MPIRISWEADDTIVYESDTEDEWRAVNAVMCGDALPAETPESTRVIIQTALEHGRQQEQRRLVAVLTKLSADYPELRKAIQLIQGFLRRPL